MPQRVRRLMLVAAVIAGFLFLCVLVTIIFVSGMDWSRLE